MFAASKTAGVTGGVNYIEDVFSTYLYTGNGSTQTITNGIDLSGKGGLVWAKSRTIGAYSHVLFDTLRGVNNALSSDSTFGQIPTSSSLTAFNSNGFNIGSSVVVNANSGNYVSWTFRKQPKFFDVVTWSGTGAASQVINHNLGSVPGFIIVKAYSGTSGSSNWYCYHRSLGNTSNITLNLTDASDSNIAYWRNTSPTSTQFTVGSVMNDTSTNFVAYLFAHNAGGFGLTGTDNVISCGSYTGTGAASNFVNLGYEPQWLITKDITSANDWRVWDNMRGVTTGDVPDAWLIPNLANAESSGNQYVAFNANGFTLENLNGSINASGDTYIYIAIRRGPMKVPTDATTVFGLSARSGTGANATVTGGQTDDAVLVKNRGSAVASLFSSRLTGTGYLVTSATDAEVAAGTTILQANPWDVMDGVKVGTTSTITNASGNTFINYLFKRAPSFFDEVCYTGTGANTTQTHNLGVVPELMVVKRRDSGGSWVVYSSALGATKYVLFDSTSAALTSAVMWANTAPTSSVFTVNSSNSVNQSGGTYVAYLFATCAGVSKVGSYTGNGTTQAIACGFTGGARFVLIKRTDSTGNWYVYDTARGMTVLTDPYLLLNSTAAESATLGSVITSTGGFTVDATILAAINTNAATYIFLAIA
jgi:hypothetical protein